MTSVGLHHLDSSLPSSAPTARSVSVLAGKHTQPYYISSSDHTHGHYNTGSSSMMAPDQTRPRSASSSSKALLTRALVEAQSAVQLDNANDIPAALEAYNRAVALLSKVMDASSSPEEQERLRTIHDSYLFRIHLLSTPPAPAAAPTTPYPQHNTPPIPQPPQQPLPPAPRQTTPLRSAGISSSSLGSSSSSSSSQHHIEDSDNTTRSSSAAKVPPPRRIRKHVPVPLHPSSMANSGIHPPLEPRTPRQRSDSTSASEHGTSSGHTRHHTRSHTGGSTPRMTGDLVYAAEQLQIQAQQRLLGPSKIRSRDHLGVPMYSAPTVPLPPTPTALGPPPSTPPPVPVFSQGQGSTMSTPTHSNPPTPNMPGNQTFLTSLPSSPPPKTSLPPGPPNIISPPGSPANTSRRISPLVPASTLSGQQLQSSQRSLLSPSENSPDDEKTHGAILSRFYDDDLVSDEWLPNLSSSSFSTAEVLDHSSEDPYPRERVSSKGSYTLNQVEQIRSKSAQSLNTVQEVHKAGGDTLSSQQRQQISQHQRSFSQSSNLSAHQSTASQSRSPLYNVQQAASSISSLHALESATNKRISDSSRSLKEGSPLARSSGGSGVTNGVGAGSSSSSLSSLPGQSSVTRPAVLQHQHSSSKLSTTLSNSTSASPTLDKTWSPSLNGSTHNHGSSGGMTLYDVISDDPFAGMSFPLPPPFVEPPPTDPHLRCFWLMRKLEQTMTTGGFLTKRMYVPRAIWYQSLVRLPAAGIKIEACRTLYDRFDEMAKQSQNGTLNLLVEGGPEVDAERMAILKELESLEATAHSVQSKLSKKLSFINRPGKNGLNLTITTNQGYQEDMQGPVTGGTASLYGAASLYGTDSYNWGNGDEPPMPNSEKTSKKGGVSVGGSTADAGSGGLKSQWKSLSKTFQKIGNDKVEDTSAYTENVVHLFQSSYILESMLRHYNAHSHYHVHLQIVNRLRRLCDVLSQVICAFVVRDLGELMGKYVKRVGAWVAD